MIIETLCRVFEANPGAFTLGTIILFGSIFAGVSSIIYAVKHKPS